MKNSKFNFWLLTACMAGGFAGCFLTRFIQDPIQSLLTSILIIIAALVVYETFDKD